MVLSFNSLGLRGWNDKFSTAGGWNVGDTCGSQACKHTRTCIGT